MIDVLLQDPFVDLHASSGEGGPVLEVVRFYEAEDLLSVFDKEAFALGIPIC